MFHSVSVYKIPNDVEDHTTAVAAPRSWGDHVEGTGFFDTEFDECIEYHDRMVERYKEQIDAGEMVVVIVTSL